MKSTVSLLVSDRTNTSMDFEGYRIQDFIKRKIVWSRPTTTPEKVMFVRYMDRIQTYLLTFNLLGVI